MNVQQCMSSLYLCLLQSEIIKAWIDVIYLQISKKLRVPVTIEQLDSFLQEVIIQYGIAAHEVPREDAADNALVDLMQVAVSSLPKEEVSEKNDTFSIKKLLQLLV